MAATVHAHWIFLSPSKSFSYKCFCEGNKAQNFELIWTGFVSTVCSANLPIRADEDPVQPLSPRKIFTAIGSYFCVSKPFHSRCSVTLYLLLMYSLGKLPSTKPPIVIVRKSLTHSSFQLLVIMMLKKRESFAANSCNNVFVCHMRWKSDRQYLCTPSVTLDWSSDEIPFRNLLTPAGAASLKEKKIHFLLLVLLCGGRPCLPLH